MIIELLASGYEHLEDCVKPYVASILQHEPEASVTIVDNGSPVPYPALDGVKVVHTKNLAIMTSFNKAIAKLKSEWDWIILTDSDVICNGPFLEAVAGWNPDFLYGMQMFHQWDLHWFDGWLMAISKKAWQALGPFDDAFKLTGAFQDMDYCLRAQQAGYFLRMANLPFVHLEGNTTHRSPGFWENREHNRQLINSKHGIQLIKP